MLVILARGAEGKGDARLSRQPQQSVPEVRVVWGFTTSPPPPPHPYAVGTFATSPAHKYRSAWRRRQRFLGVSDLGWDTEYPGIFRGITQSLQTNDWTAPSNRS
jgi:hypothetical protein